jgi:hypothetical protein
MKGMANEEHLGKLLEGVEAWNEWMLKNPDLHPDLQGANLSDAQLQGADLRNAQLQGAILNEAQLQGAILNEAQLQGAILMEAQLQGADLSGAFFDNATSLEKVILGDEKYGVASLADVSWGGVNLAVVDWSPLKMLGDEYQARDRPPVWIRMNDKANRLEFYRTAVRANRQLAVVLRDQGLNEEADHYAYRAQLLKRKVLWMQLGRWKWVEDVRVWILSKQNWMRFLALSMWIQESGLWKQVAMFGRWLHRVGLRAGRIGSFLFSFFLGLLAGYGYRPGRALFWYLFIIIGFTVAYATIGHLPAIPDALVFSLTSFHGRGFFPGLGNEASLHNPLVVLAAFEAVVGLFIEISFIATFTQRFFGR